MNSLNTNTRIARHTKRARRFAATFACSASSHPRPRVSLKDVSQTASLSLSLSTPATTSNRHRATRVRGPSGGCAAPSSQRSRCCTATPAHGRRRVGQGTRRGSQCALKAQCRGSYRPCARFRGPWAILAGPQLGRNSIWRTQLSTAQHGIVSSLAAETDELYLLHTPIASKWPATTLSARPAAP